MRAAKNVSKRMTWVIASLVLLFSQITPVVLSTARAKAAAYELGTSSGVWTDTNGGSGITGINTGEVRWGTPANDQNKKSGLKFAGSSNQTFNEGDKFLLGELTHFNWPVAGGTAATGATLKIALHFTSPVVAPDPDFTYDFVIDETTNRTPCDSWQISNTPCDDMITFPNSYGSKSFTIGDKLYTLKIEGFTNCGAGGSPVSQFITEESKDSKACLYGSLSSVLVNKPQLTLVEKAVNGDDADVAPGPTLYVGDTASFTYKVQNTGNVTMTDITVTDDKGVAVTCPKTTLLAGELMTCTGSSAVVAGQYTNSAVAKGKYSGQTYTSNNEKANYTGIAKPGNLTVTKVVTNDDGGTAVVSDFPLFVNGNSVTSGQSKSYAPGTYTITETQKNGYLLTGVSGNCTKNSQTGVITVSVVTNGNATCTLTNNDKAPKLTLKKAVTKDNGGTAQPADWTVRATPGANNVNATTISGNGNNGVIDVTAKAGVAYTLSELNGPSGYSLVGWSCTGGTLNGTILTLGLDQSVTCTVTNNDVAPGLTLVKNLVKDNGGTANATDWTLKATGTGGTPTNLSGVTGSAGATSGASFKADTYTLSETGGPGGYTKSAWSCTNGVTVTNSQITLTNGKTTVCTITNDDDAAGLTLVKNLVDQYGSGANKTDWTLTATGPTMVSGAGGASNSNVSAGTYNLTESGQTYGFDASAWSCPGADIVGTTLKIALGQNVTCTITNTAQPAKLIVKKVVINDDGGKAGFTNFSFKVNGGNSVSFEADGQNELNNLPKGTYTVVEDQANQDGYSTTYDGCTSVAISNGETKTCTITNDDVAPTLTVKKIAKNDNGGTKLSSDFGLYSNGNKLTGGSTVANGATSTTTYTVVDASASAYVLTEDEDDAYTASNWTCTGNSTALDGNKVTLKLGENVTCEITNDDDSPSLTLLKKVVDNYGYNAVASDWILTATGPTNLSGAGGVAKTNVDAGNYALGETSGKWNSKYWDSEWSCEGGNLAGQALTIALAQNVKCTVTNTMKGGKIVVHKEVINDDEGTSTAKDFSVTVNGKSQNFVQDENNELLGETTFYVPGNATYGVSEDGEEDSDYITTYSNNCDEINSYDKGYDENCYSGDCEELYVAIGETVDCYVENDDVGNGDGPNVDLIVNKDDGGAIVAAGDTFNYTLDVYNNTFFWNAVNVVLTDVIPSSLKVNSITAGAWSCDVTGADANGYGGTLTCKLPTLGGQHSADTITLNVTVKDGTTKTIFNTVTVKNDRAENNNENNTDTEQTPVKAIQVVKSGPATANAGDVVTYTFTVTNSGDVPLSSITVADNIAGNGVYQSGDTNNNSVLDLNETWVYTAKYTIPSGTTNQVVNTVKACGAAKVVNDELPSEQIQFLRISTDSIVAQPTEQTPVCDDDMHVLNINPVLVNTGTPIYPSIFAGLMILGALAAAVPSRKYVSSRNR